jgi:hypothetical protein
MCGLACGDLCAALVQLSSWLFLALVIPLTCLYEVWCVEVVLSHCCRMTFFFYHDAPYPLLFGACLLILLSLLVFYLCSGSMFPLFCLFKGACSLCSLVCTCMYILTHWFSSLVSFWYLKFLTFDKKKLKRHKNHAIHPI